MSVSNSETQNHLLRSENLATKGKPLFLSAPLRFSFHNQLSSLIHDGRPKAGAHHDKDPASFQTNDHFEPRAVHVGRGYARESGHSSGRS